LRLEAPSIGGLTQLKTTQGFKGLAGAGPLEVLMTTMEFHVLLESLKYLLIIAREYFRNVLGGEGRMK
jgi:hypothetical protein